jgi:hypothetical protein
LEGGGAERNESRCWLRCNRTRLAGCGGGSGEDRGGLTNLSEPARLLSLLRKTFLLCRI